MSEYKKGDEIVGIGGSELWWVNLVMPEVSALRAQHQQSGEIRDFYFDQIKLAWADDSPREPADESDCL